MEKEKVEKHLKYLKEKTSESSKRFSADSGYISIKKEKNEIIEKEINSLFEENYFYTNEIFKNLKEVEEMEELINILDNKKEKTILKFFCFLIDLDYSEWYQKKILLFLFKNENLENSIKKFFKNLNSIHIVVQKNNYELFDFIIKEIYEKSLISSFINDFNNDDSLSILHSYALGISYKLENCQKLDKRIIKEIKKIIKKETIEKKDKFNRTPIDIIEEKNVIDLDSEEIKEFIEIFK